MYFGPRSGMLPWFTRGLGLAYTPSQHGLPADWVLDVVNISFRKPRRIYGAAPASRAQLDAAADAFELASVALPAAPAAAPAAGENGCAAAADGTSGSSAVATVAAAVAVSASAPPASGRPAASPQPPRRPGFFRQAAVLLRRESLATARNPADVAGRVLVFSWLGLLVGLVFYDLGLTVGGLRGRLNLLYLELNIFVLARCRWCAMRYKTPRLPQRQRADFRC